MRLCFLPAGQRAVVEQSVPITGYPASLKDLQDQTFEVAGFGHRTENRMI